MNSGTIIDELRALVRSLRVLSPDHELEAQRPAAIQWIEDRVECAWELARSPITHREGNVSVLERVEREVIEAFWEFTRAENDFGRPKIDRLLTDANRLPLPEKPTRERPAVRLSRSMSAVFDRWASRASRRDGFTVFDPVVLVHARVSGSYTSRDHLAMMMLAIVGEEPNLRAKIQGGSLFAHPAVECAIDHLLWQRLFNEPSPLGPWIELWQRGLWPCWGDDGTAHVFNPVLGEGGVALIEPSADRASVPRNAAYTLLPTSHAGPSARDAVLAWAGDYLSLRPLPLGDERVYAGRSVDAAVLLRHETVARRHVTFNRVEDRWRVIDNQTANGLAYQRAYRREELLLSGGETLRLGGAYLVFLGSAC